MSDDARLERIENKLDQVGTAIVALARVEERMVTLFKHMDKLDADSSGLGKRMAAVENRVGSNGQMLRFAERVFWIVVTGAVAFAFNYMRG